MTKHRRKNGSLMDVNISVSSFTQEQDSYTAIFCRDISAQVEAIKRQDELKEINALVLKTTLDGYILGDGDGNVIDVNDSYLKLSGYSREELLAKNITEVSEVVPAQELEDRLKNIIARGGAQFETIHATKKGEKVNLAVSISPHIIKGESYAAAFYRDITEQKKLEKELQKFREHLEDLVIERTKELKEANEELDSFSYSVSHDLRAPLTRIIGFSKVLQDKYADQLDDKGIHYLNRLIYSSQNMGSIIDDLLKLSKISRHELKCRPINLSEECKIIIRGLKENESDRLVEVKIEPDLIGYFDPGLVRQLLENLLGNAWKYTKNQNPAFIEFGQLRRKEKDWFFIRDNGVGFDMKFYDKIFRPFQRLHSLKEFKGNGIGLATVHRIIKKHDGEIEAESEINKGTTFYFRV